MFQLAPYAPQIAGLGQPSAPSVSPGNPYGQTDIGPLGRTALMGASMVPGPVGMIASLGGLALRGANVTGLQNMANEIGIPGLTTGQTIGGLLGLNGYGAGDAAALSHMLTNNGINPSNAGALFGAQSPPTSAGFLGFGPQGGGNGGHGFGTGAAGEGGMVGGNNVGPGGMMGGGV